MTWKTQIFLGPTIRFNPWIGCTKVSPACDNCYAERDFATRFKVVEWGPGKARKRTGEDKWREPAKLARKAAARGVRETVFTLSLGDVFEPLPELEDVRDDLLRVVARTSYALDWLFLTKRPAAAAGGLWKRCERVYGAELARLCDAPPPRGEPDRRADYRAIADAFARLGCMPNVAPGVTAESQEWAGRRVPALLQLPAPFHFVSAEPLVGPVDLSPWLPLPGDKAAARRVRWVITGGESGLPAQDVRPYHPDWARLLRDQCRAAEIPFHFKQHGEWISVNDYSPFDMPALTPDTPHAFVLSDGRWGVGDDFRPEWRAECRAGGELPVSCYRIGVRAAGRTLDGETHDGLPAWPLRAAAGVPA